MRVKLALSTLCENPRRRTGLSTLFPELVAHARRAFPDVSWIVFTGRDAPWPEGDPAVELCRDYPSNERPLRRLLADHLGVAPEARRRGAAALLTVGFFPVRCAGLAVAMHVVASGSPRGGGWIRSGYRRWAVARGLRRAALVIANSSWTRSELGPAAAAVIVSPEGLRHDLFNATGPAGARGAPARYLLWVSNLYPYKRIELALAAYARLAPQRRSEFPLVVAGGNWAGGRARAEAAARRLGVAGDVRFLGWVDDAELPALYRGAHAHVLSTSGESFGRTVLEAMACGCPGVVQDLPVLREVAGGCVLYADFADPSLASGAVEQLCADAALRGRLSAAGIERAGEFSFERLARERVGAILARLPEAPP
ncbi:MAG TPA: glycosyltransferase family 1 protein [Opitutaceae bacterium]|nr:glycosyltransferase family 1 protein [Opitutaceae bacterium]